MRYPFLPTIVLTFGLFLIFQTGNVSAQDHFGVDGAPTKWLEHVRPELEKFMGLVPRLPLLQPLSLSRQADPDVAACVKWRWPHLKDDALARALQDAEAVTASATVARLVEGTNVILIRPENQKIIAGWNMDLAKADSPDFFKLALIHETVRYVLDSRYDIAKRRQACQNAEDWFALEALIEGRAQWVTRQLARKLGMEESFPLLAERFVHVPDQDRDPALRTISQSVVHRRHWAYEKGLAFFEYLENQGLGDVEKLVFSKPPKLTKWIEEPELYVKAMKSKRPDLATILTKLEKTPPPGNWMSTQQAWTPEMMIQVGGLIGDQELAKKIADSLPEGRSLVWSDKNNLGRHVALTITRFQTSSFAHAYHGLVQDLQGKREEIAKGALNLVKTHVKMVGDKGLENCVIEISWYGIEPDQGWAERIMALLPATDHWPLATDSP